MWLLKIPTFILSRCRQGRRWRSCNRFYFFKNRFVFPFWIIRRFPCKNTIELTFEMREFWNELIMSYVNESCYIWMSHVPYKWVISLTNKSRHKNEAKNSQTGNVISPLLCKMSVWLTLEILKRHRTSKFTLQKYDIADFWENFCWENSRMLSRHWKYCAKLI